MTRPTALAALALLIAAASPVAAAPSLEDSLANFRAATAQRATSPRAPGGEPDSLEKVLAELDALPGRVGLLAARLGDDVTPLAARDPDGSYGIGSAFKLYVLGRLVEEGVPWSQALRLRAAQRSFPSGITQAWPDQAPVTVHSLATLMLSLSDNTATDTLLRLAGRADVEAQLETMGHSDPASSQPFLTTREMFQVKLYPEVLAAYRDADASTRRAILADELAQRPLPPASAAQTWEDPIAIDQVEWFASPADLVRCMDWFRRRGDQTALEIMGVNRGFHLPEDIWPYVGFKGGSEPGVFNFTFLLQRHDGEWFSLSTSWNDTDAPLDSQAYFPLVQRTLELLATAP